MNKYLSSLSMHRLPSRPWEPLKVSCSNTQWWQEGSQGPEKPTTKTSFNQLYLHSVFYRSFLVFFIGVLVLFTFSQEPSVNLSDDSHSSIFISYPYLCCLFVLFISYIILVTSCLISASCVTPDTFLGITIFYLF